MKKSEGFADVVTLLEMASTGGMIDKREAERAIDILSDKDGPNNPRVLLAQIAKLISTIKKLRDANEHMAIAIAEFKSVRALCDDVISLFPKQKDGQE